MAGPRVNDAADRASCRASRGCREWPAIDLASGVTLAIWAFARPSAFAQSRPSSHGRAWRVRGFGGVWTRPALTPWPRGAASRPALSTTAAARRPPRDASRETPAAARRPPRDPREMLAARRPPRDPREIPAARRPPPRDARRETPAAARRPPRDPREMPAARRPPPRDARHAAGRAPHRARVRQATMRFRDRRAPRLKLATGSSPNAMKGQHLRYTHDRPRRGLDAVVPGERYLNWLRSDVSFVEPRTRRLRARGPWARAQPRKFQRQTRLILPHQALR
jgi:hypothetical protein